MIKVCEYLKEVLSMHKLNPQFGGFNLCKMILDGRFPINVVSIRSDANVLNIHSVGTEYYTEVHLNCFFA